MARLRKPNPERLAIIAERQNEPHWGVAYTPSILATPGEAPPGSRPSILVSTKIGRRIHVLSIPERKATVLGLYHPSSFYLEEQKMLSPGPRPHPFIEHGLVRGERLPSFKGMLDVCERLGHLKAHPKILIPSPDDSKRKIWSAYPLIGDLLWYLRDAAGPYCVNFNVKDEPASFTKPRLTRQTKRAPKLLEHAAQVRFDIEKEHYWDAEIRTEAVTEAEIDEQVSANLLECFRWHNRTLPDEDLRGEILRRFESAIAAGFPPNEVIFDYVRRGRATQHSCLVVFYQSIWNRLLRVDLFSPILVDWPIAPEKKDVIEVYSKWFRR